MKRMLKAAPWGMLSSLVRFLGNILLILFFVSYGVFCFPANGCLSLLVRWLGNRVTPEAMKPCFDLLEHQVKSATKYEYPLLISMLQLMTCLAEQQIVASHLPLETIQHWMEVSSWVICSARSREILTHVAKLLRAIVKVKNVSLLIEVYRFKTKFTDKVFVVTLTWLFLGDWHRIWTIVLQF
jgi:hypothetical protein